MPLKNLANTFFTPEEQQELDSLANRMIEIIEPKIIQLSRKERQRYGSINEQNKLIVNKVLDFQQATPDLSSREVDWDNYRRHHEERSFLGKIISKIKSIFLDLSSTKMMHDYDNLQAARTDYSYTKYLAKQGVPGAIAKLEDLKQLFRRSKNSMDDLGPENDMEE